MILFILFIRVAFIKIQVFTVYLIYGGDNVEVSVMASQNEGVIGVIATVDEITNTSASIKNANKDIFV